MRKSKILALMLALVMCLTMPMETVMATTTQTVETQDETTTKSEDTYETAEKGDLGQHVWVTFDQEELAQAEPEDNEVEESTGASSEWDVYASDYLYNKMSSAQKKLYNKLDDVCRKALTSKTSYNTLPAYDSNYNYLGSVGVLPAVSYSGLSAEIAQRTAYIFMYNNPQYYFLSLISSISDTDVMLCTLEDFADGSDRATATSKIKSKLTSWNKAIAAESGVLAKEKKAHDLVTVHTTYKANKYDQTVYSVLVKGQSVCAGYAQTFQMLCNKAGIETVVVTSKVHEWNKIKINGTVDCTWDDLDGYENYAAYYPYMNRSSSVIKSSQMDQQSSHVEESYWPSYTPSCTKDAPVSYAPIKNSSVSQTIKASSVTKTYKKNATFKLGAKITKGSGKLSYASSNKKVVTVNSTGTLTIKGYGKSTITIVANATTKYQKTSKKVAVTINPVKQTISKATAKGSGKISVTYKKDSLASGYQIQYSTSSKFSSAKSVKVASKSTGSRIITGLSKGKKYYVRVRTYKNSGSSRVYGSWSATKSVNVK